MSLPTVSLHIILNSYVVTKDHLKPLLDAGIKGFKCFLIESGVDVRLSSSTLLRAIPDGLKQEFPCVSKADLERAMHVLQVSAFRFPIDVI